MIRPRRAPSSAPRAISMIGTIGFAVATLWAATLASTGCAAARPIVASTADYDAYREYRLAPGMGERMAAAWRYLRDHPQGDWAKEVSAWFRPTEQLFFAENGRSPGGAAAYLAFLPDGPHAEEERTLLRAWEREKAEGPAREKAALEEAKRKSEAARRALGESIELWTKRALSITTWSESLEQLEAKDKGFGTPYRLQQPYALCTDDGCSKVLGFKYAIPDALPAQDRTVTLDVRLELDTRKVWGVTLVAPKGGFTWWLEGAEARSIDLADEATRIEALMRAKNRIEKVVREARPEGCTTTEKASTRSLDCADVRVVIEPMANGDDVVRIVGWKPKP